jgi:hypothetical protein
LQGLRVFLADGASEAGEVFSGTGKYWSRRGIAEWLVEILLEDRRAIVGIDHGFSFPLLYFQQHGVPLDWTSFLEDFQRHWPTDEDQMSVDFVREGVEGNAAARSGNSKWRRVTEIRSVRAKSVFHFDVPGSVAKSTHSGLPWLLHVRRNAGQRVHFWPFDGWKFAARKSVIAEVYPRLWSPNFERGGRNEHQHDAYSIAAWLQLADTNCALAQYADPQLSGEERRTAEVTNL